jgi:hypothetical protein
MCTKYQMLNGDQTLAKLMGNDRVLEPYLGQKAKSNQDEATQVCTGLVPLRVILSLFHEVTVGGATTLDLIDLVNHMTPGVSIWGGLTSPLRKYAEDVCRPELRRQLPELACIMPPTEVDLGQFYEDMVARFGETVQVSSIAKQIA